MAVDHYENFPVASWLLPKHLRAAVIAIYWFARTADDIADEGTATNEERLNQLGAYRGALDLIADARRHPPCFAEPMRPIFNPLFEAVQRHQLDTAPLYRLLTAFSQDVHTKRYATYRDLETYCHHSANPIGELLLSLYGVNTPPRLHLANAVCTGLQLTNFWQDVAVDWQKGRVYLPEADMQAFGVQTWQIAQQHVDLNWSALMSYQVQRTRGLLNSGMSLCQHLPARMALELKMVVLGGLRVLDLLEAASYNMFQSRPRLGWQDRAIIFTRSLLPQRA